MTEQTLERAIEIRRNLERERKYKKDLEDIVNNTGNLPERAEFKVIASIKGCTYERDVYISNEVADMALYKEIENCSQRIASLETELDGLH